mgnify:CR=1 FL=1
METNEAEIKEVTSSFLQYFKNQTDRFINHQVVALPCLLVSKQQG